MKISSIFFWTAFFTNIAVAGSGLLPDLQTVVPLHLNLVNEHQRELLRFSNGIANTGQGPLQLRPETSGPTTLGIQQILDASGNVVQESLASVYEFHEAHNHWHLGSVARFEIRTASPSGKIFGGNSIKTTFCLIDWYQLERGNNGVSGATYFDCVAGLQGISPGWVDQYHQATDGQSLDLTGAPEGLYYLVSIANPDGNYAESNSKNNTAWVGFRLSRDSKGNAKIKVVSHSPCATPGLCGENAPNR